MGETDWEPPSPPEKKKELLAIIFHREGTSSIELKTGSHFGGQNRHIPLFTKHLQKAAGDEVCLRTATQRFKQGRKKTKQNKTPH